MNWTFNTDPQQPGIYAVLVCYDSEEGAFPSHDEWDGARWKGERWEGSRPVVAYAGPFDSEQKAEEWADKNDPDAAEPERMKGGAK